MKKQLIALVVFSVLGVSAGAQVNPHAIGLRGGAGTYGGGGEVTYQHGLGSSNRLELDLGWHAHSRKNDYYSHGALAAVYQWVWNIEGGFNWYAGPGAQLGFYSNRYDSNSDGLTLGLGGQIGVEFDFNDIGAPLLLSLDARPMYRFIGGGSGFGYGGALSLRYTF